MQGTGVRNLHTQADNVVSTQVASVEEIMAPVPGELIQIRGFQRIAAQVERPRQRRNARGLYPS